MLDSLRDAAKTWVAGIFIFFLILSFGVWGIQDFLGASSPNEIAKVGGVAITPQDFSRQFQQDKRRLERNAETPLSAKQIRELKLHEQTLQNLIDKVAIILQAESIGLTASQNQVIGYLKQQPGLTDPSGNLDPNRMQEVMRDNNLNEALLYKLVHDDMLREQITNSLLTGVALPDGMSNALNHVRRQRRIVQYLLIDPSRAGDLQDPTPEILKTYFAANNAQFKRPEFRTISLLSLSPKDLAKTIEIKEEDLKAAYERVKGRYVIKEKRKLEQIRFKDEAAAKDGAARLAAGEKFDAVAVLQGMKAAEIQIGLASEGDTSVPAEVFKIAVNQPTAPFKGPFGWAILRTTEITPGSTKTFEDARTEIKDALALEKAKTQASETINAVEDTLGSGATLEEAATKNKLTVRTIASLNAAGKGDNDQVIDGLPKDPEFMGQVFSSESGKEGSVASDGEGGYYVMRVDNVVPSATPPLDAIRDKVLQKWRDDTIAKKLEKIADDLVVKGNKGETMKTLAEGLGIAPLTSPRLAREINNDIFSTEIVKRIFDLKPGRFTHGPVGMGKSLLVVRLDHIDVSSDPVEAQLTPMYIERARQSLAGDIAATFTSATRSQIGVTEPDAAKLTSLIEQN